MTTRANHPATFSLRVASGDQLDVRQFTTREQLSTLFSVSVTVVADNADIDFEALIGQPAQFEALGGVATEQSRVWTGICKEVQECAAEETGLSTYVIEIVPVLWLLSQRRNHRMFQLVSEVEIALQILSEWGIEPVQKLSAVYKKRKYRVQYAESDYAFLCRMLEDAGISFYFATEGAETRMVLADTPQNNQVREPKIRFRDNPGASDLEHVTALRIVRQVRPGRYTLRDHDYRRPAVFKLLASATQAAGVEQQLEQFHYAPGAFLYENDKGEASPTADDKGRYRTDDVEATGLARRRLDVKRSEATSFTFQSNAIDLAPGVVIGVAEHPRQDLGDNRHLLILSSTMTCVVGKASSVHCEARRADIPFRPALATPRPRVNGVESATVVGPSGEEIHTDEFGRIRVHFHWDRESEMNENSSCWIHVSQPWGGAGYGGVNLPRVGQEVLVDFLGGDPDRPVVVGRVYTNLQKVPYKLPGSKTQSGWKSNSTNATGGYNELMFEDAAGSELLRMQAEKDMQTLVKNDQRESVVRDRTRDVGRNESVLIGKNLTKQVTGNERETTGLNRSITVGVNRTTQIGSRDVTMVGVTHLVMITPPGEDGPSTSSSIMMTDKKIVLDTGAGARITLDHDKITIEADDLVEIHGKKRGVNVHASAPGGSANIFSGKGFSVSTEKIDLTAVDVNIVGTTLNLCGIGSVELTSSGTTTVSGTPVQLNGPGMFAGRVTELAPATITTGAALVLIGGASFPLPVVRQSDDSLKIGDHLIVKKGEGRYPDFQNRVMRDLGIIASTPNGLQRLNNIQNNPGGHDVTIREYSNREAEDPAFGPNNSVNIAKDAGKAQLGYDKNGNPVPGSGSSSEIGYNPDIAIGPDGGPKEPGDAVLFHELGHADHVAYGTERVGEKTLGPRVPYVAGYENREEWQTIDGGVNEPGGTQVPGVPRSPSENEYLGDRNYPYRRIDHGGGYEFPDGTPLA
jgi:type VI secretion system secreted protein VgrG